MAPGVVNDPAGRRQIQVDVAVLAPEDGATRRVVSLGEAKWDEVMTPTHLSRLRRARDLLAVRTERLISCHMQPRTRGRSRPSG